jgi:small-conductance mechanosensitive channel
LVEFATTYGINIIGAVVILIVGRIAAGFAIGFALQGSLSSLAAGILTTGQHQGHTFRTTRSTVMS